MPFLPIRIRAEELDFEYNPDGDGEYPAYTRADWRLAVAERDTLLGYWEWVAHMLEEEAT